MGGGEELTWLILDVAGILSQSAFLIHGLIWNENNSTLNSFSATFEYSKIYFSIFYLLIVVGYLSRKSTNYMYSSRQ